MIIIFQTEIFFSVLRQCEDFEQFLGEMRWKQSMGPELGTERHARHLLSSRDVERKGRRPRLHRPRES